MHAKNVILCLYSTLLQLFYDYSNFTKNNINSDDEYQLILDSLTFQFQDNFHNFTHFYILQKILLGTNVDLLYKKENFSKIKIYWKEAKYLSDFSIEGDSFSYFLYSFKISNIRAQKHEQFQQDIQNFIFHKETSNTYERINTYFIRLVYYICNNYQFIFRRIYILFEKDIYNDYIIYIGPKMVIYKILEIIGIILASAIYIIVIILLFYSNQTIIKNIIFLFLDFNEKEYKIKKNDFKINYKLYEIKQLIEDFDLKRFDKFIENENKIDINLFSYNNDNNENVSTINNNSFKKSSIHNLEKENIVKMINNSKTRNNLFDIKNRGSINNSSYNNLSSSNSQLIKVNLKNDLINVDKKLDFNINKNNKKFNEENKENIHELILNSANKTCIFMIIIYFIILSIFILGFIIFIYYKLYINVNMNDDVDNFFTDMEVVTDRYNILFYAFNIFRTMILFSEGDKKRKFEEILENIGHYYEEGNNKYLNIISSKVMIKHFYRTRHFMMKLTESKNNSTKTIKNLICGNYNSCHNYLDSENNFFDSGVDFGYKSALTFINNMYLDYKRLNNKYDINIINETIINSKNSHFKDIGLGLNNLFLLIFDKIFFYFKDDINEFLLYKISNSKLFNILILILLVFIFIFCIGFVFISIFKFIESFKESVYRLSCSFYFIKKEY